MSDTKHGLTGAFYGPPVPPSRARHTSRGIARSATSCCCGCLFCALFQVLITILVIIGIIILALWLIFRPNAFKVHVDDATLSRFDLSTSPNNSLLYQLSLNVSIRNPNRRISIYYDYIEAVASYDGYRFGYDNTLPVFFQGHKNTTIIQPEFTGQQALAVPSTATTYLSEKTDGWYSVEVKINTKVRFKFWFVKSNKYKPKFTCDLKIPAPSSKETFQLTKCDVDL